MDVMLKDWQNLRGFSRSRDIHIVYVSRLEVAIRKPDERRRNPIVKVLTRPDVSLLTVASCRPDVIAPTFFFFFRYILLFFVLGYTAKVALQGSEEIFLFSVTFVALHSASISPHSQSLKIREICTKFIISITYCRFFLSHTYSLIDKFEAIRYHLTIFFNPSALALFSYILCSSGSHINLNPSLSLSFSLSSFSVTS